MNLDLDKNYKDCNRTRRKHIVYTSIYKYANQQKLQQSQSLVHKMMNTILTTSNSLHDYLNKWNNYININNTIPWYDDDEELPKLEMPKPLITVPTQTRTSHILSNGFTIIQKKAKVRKDTKTKKINGQITKFIFNKGYGFIKSNKYNVPIFLHKSDITPNSLQNLVKSTNAYFELQKDKNGRLVAKNCQIY